MTVLAKYLDTNKEKAYSFATSNTKYNDEGRPVISRDDEWLNETEWDELQRLRNGEVTLLLSKYSHN